MKLSIREIIGYSMGDFTGSRLWQTMAFFLPVFYTDVFLLPAASVATLFIVVRIFDALNDPIMGTIADRTHRRWGKFRPYLTLVGVMTPDPVERTSLSSYKFVFACAAGLMVQALLIPMVEKMGRGNAALFMVSGTIAVLLGVLPTKMLSRSIGKRNLFITCLGVIVISLVIIYMASPENLVLILATQITFSFASGPNMPLLWSMLADTADYSEWKNGRRATGLIYIAGQKKSSIK